MKAIDRENGNNLWDKAIKKELTNTLISFHLLEDGEPIPAGSKEIPYHIIFDIKLRLVAGGNKHKDVPSYATYSSVVSRETVRLGFLLAEMNGLDILEADISNAYLNSPCKEKVHVKVGSELFGRINEGRYAVIVRALYGQKTAGTSWREHLSATIQTEFKFKPSRGDPGIYLREKRKLNGNRYYDYLIVYVDDILSIDLDPNRAIEIIGEYFKIKDNSTEFPKMYLGAIVRRWTIQDEDGMDSQTFALGSSSYVKEAIRTVEERMLEYGLKFHFLLRHIDQSWMSHRSRILN